MRLGQVDPLDLPGKGDVSGANDVAATAAGALDPVLERRQRRWVSMRDSCRD